jgi:hypothetical protein
VWDLTGRFHSGRFVARPAADRDLERLWSELGGSDADAAYRAVLDLAASPGNAAPFLQKHVERLVQPVDAKRVAELAGDLDSAEFERRRGAALELEKMGLATELHLRAKLGGAPSLEARRGLERVLERLAQVVAQADRALEALERMDDAAARRALRAIEARARETSLGPSATASLRRSEPRPAVPPKPVP